MKILQLCLRIPYPPIDGGNIAMLNMAQALQHAGCEVNILAFNTKKHIIKTESLPAYFTEQFKLRSVFVDASIKLWPAFKNLFSNRSYNIDRFISEDFEKELVSVLTENKYDVIMLESLFMTPYIDTIKKLSVAKLVMHAHNVEHIIWKRLQLTENNFLKKKYLRLLAFRLENYEKSVCKKTNAIIALTTDDEKLFKSFCGQVPVFAVPIGLDVAHYKNEIAVVKNEVVKLFHLGSMDWMPNIEAVDWFLKNVWPYFEKSDMQIELHLAGRDMPEHIFKRAGNKLKIYGRIENAKAFLSDKDVMIVPLLSGSGMRVKIIEGMASGKCIISTTIGAEGISYTDGENIFIADTPAQFIEVIQNLYKNKNRITATGSNAQKLAEDFYDNKVIGERVKQILASI